MLSSMVPKNLTQKCLEVAKNLQKLDVFIKMTEKGAKIPLKFEIFKHNLLYHRTSMENVCAEIQVDFFENVVLRTNKRAKFATFCDIFEGCRSVTQSEGASETSNSSRVKTSKN